MRPEFWTDGGGCGCDSTGHMTYKQKFVLEPGSERKFIVPERWCGVKRVIVPAHVSSPDPEVSCGEMAFKRRRLDC